MIQKIFNISCEYEIRKANYYPNSNILYRIRLGSMAFISALKDLGLVQRNGEKKRAARYKQVPWSILQADQNCQMAYLAGYIEGDGHINDCSIKIYSTSSKNLRQMQMMLGIYGLFSDIKNITLSLSKESSFYLAQKAKSYFISKFLPKYDLENLNSQSVLGIPTKGIGELLRSRKDLSKANSAGQSRYYFNDSGKSTFIRNSEVVSITLQTINFTYTKYQQGVYDEFLKIVKKVSPSFHQKIIFALEAKMFFDPIKKLKLGRRNHVYDLVIEKSEKPAFVANGILVHNSMRPEGDSEYFARLQELQQGGIPIPIRYLATAVGIDLEDIIHGIPEDLKIRESINEYLQQIQKFSGALGTGTANPEQQNFLSSLSSLLNNGLPKTKRDFDTEKYGPRNEINGKRYILTGRERKRQEEKANKNMAQTIARVAKKLNGQDHGEQLVLPLNELRRNDGT